jgi:hypothetical protein
VRKDIGDLQSSKYRDLKEAANEEEKQKITEENAAVTKKYSTFLYKWGFLCLATGFLVVCHNILKKKHPGILPPVDQRELSQPTANPD